MMGLLLRIRSFGTVTGGSGARVPGECAGDSGHEEPEERQQQRLQPDRRPRAYRQACRERHEREHDDSVPRHLREDHGGGGEQHGDQRGGEHKGRAGVSFFSGDHLHQQERARPGCDRAGRKAKSMTSPASGAARPRRMILRVAVSGSKVNPAMKYTAVANAATTASPPRRKGTKSAATISAPTKGARPPCTAGLVSISCMACRRVG